MGNKSSTSAVGGADGGGNGSTSTIPAKTATGWHALKVKGYSQTRGLLGPGKFIESSSFTVGGHSWCIRCYPDGDQEKNGDWIAVYLALCRLASRDDIVQARFKLALLDQDGRPVPAHKVETSEAMTFSASGTLVLGYPHFIKRHCVLLDDCFSIDCEVTVIKGFGKVASKKPFVAVPPSNLSGELGGLLFEEQGADVTFEVGGELFPAHRSILAARSSVFKAELFGPMKEMTAARVRIHDMEPNVFRAMLLFIYTDSVPAMGAGERMAMAQHLLVAADRYDVKRLKSICEDELCNHINRCTAATTLVLADQHGCHGLKKACFAFLASRDNLKAVMATDGYDHLRSSCPLLHDKLVVKLSTDASKGNKDKRLPWCFSSE